MKVKTLISAYRVLDNAKLSKMSDSDKFKVILAMREIKPYVVSLDDFIKDAREKLKDEQFDVMQKRMEDMQSGNADYLTVEEKREAQLYSINYSKKLDTLAEKEIEKDAIISFDKLSKEAFEKLVASNPDLTVNNIITLSEVILQS